MSFMDVLIDFIEVLRLNFHLKPIFLDFVEIAIMPFLGRPHIGPAGTNFFVRRARLKIQSAGENLANLVPACKNPPREYEQEPRYGPPKYQFLGYLR